MEKDEVNRTQMAIFYGNRFEGRFFWDFSGRKVVEAVWIHLWGQKVSVE